MNRFVDLTFGGRWLKQFSAGYDEMGWVGEAGLHLTPNVRLAVGYSSGEVNQDRDFSGTRAAGGFYGAVTLKLDSLFDGFGLQDPLPAPQVKRQLQAELPAQNLQAALPQQESLRLDVSQTIEFSPSTAAISRKGEMVLDSLVTILSQYPDLDIDIQGKLPPLAELTPDNLDAQRLQAARQYLLSRGVGGDRIVIRSMGQAVQTTAQRDASLVSFALTGSAETFNVISQQLDSEVVGSLLSEGLPLLASQPEPETPVASTASVPQPIATATPMRSPMSEWVASLPVLRGGAPTVVGDQFAGYGEQQFSFSALGAMDGTPLKQRIAADMEFWSEVIDAPTQQIIAQALRQSDDTMAIDGTFEMAGLPETQWMAEVPAADAFIARTPQPDSAPATLLLGDRRITDNADNGEMLDAFLTGEVQPATIDEQLLLGDRRLDEDDTTENLFTFEQWSTPTTPTLTSFNLDLSNPNNGLILSQLPEAIAITSQNLTQLGDDRDTLALAPAAVMEAQTRLNYLQARELESALTFLLSRDLETLDNLLQAATQQPDLLGEVVDLDQLLQGSDNLGGLL